jgi:hypothetical protein
MDVTLVSIFLVNPLLPALPLLMVGLALLDDYTSGEGRGALIGATLAVAFLLVVKMFIGAQMLAAMGEKAEWVLGALRVLVDPELDEDRAREELKLWTLEELVQVEAWAGQAYKAATAEAERG